MRDFSAMYTRIQVASRLCSTVPGGVVQPGRHRLVLLEPMLSWQERVNSPETQTVNIWASIICNLRNDELSYERFLSGLLSHLFRISCECTA